MLEKNHTTIMGYLTINKIISFFISSLVFFIISVVMVLIGFNILVALGSSTLFLFVMMVSKKLYDKFNLNKYSIDIMDIIFTIPPLTLLFILMEYG